MAELNCEDLEYKIKTYAQKYYEGHPEISDYDFDMLVEALRATNPDSEILKTTGWGFDPGKTVGKKVMHKYGMVGSIDRKPRCIENVPKYENGRISAKLDGLSGVCYFFEGRLTSCLTRGNGEIGIDKTDKMIKILNRSTKWLSIPKSFTGAIRGEFVISNSNWRKLVEKKPELCNKSPRNYASGIINRLGIDDELDYIDYVAYKIIALEDCGHFDDYTNIASLEVWFDHVVDYVRFDQSNYNDFINQEYLEGLFKKFNEKYPCDGCVITDESIKINGYELVYDEVAYKFNGEIATTRVDHIEWNRSRTGKFVPTIVYDPVCLGGSTLRRCAGFNAKFIKDNKIGQDAIIEVMKSGEVIPDIQKVVVPSKSTELIPCKCPGCNNDLVWSASLVDLYCVNPECSARDEADLHYWTSAIADVPGLGWNIKADFFANNNINKVEDLYSNEFEFDTATATGNKLHEMFIKLKEDKIDPISAIYALNIPRLGWKSSERIYNDGLINVLLNYKDYSDVDFIALINESVGYATAENIWENREKLDRLKFVKDRFEESNNSQDESKGEIMITGKLSMKRKEFEKIAINAGYSIGSKINKDTKYLVTNTPDSNSSKNRKANELGIHKITEKCFMDLIERGE